MKPKLELTVELIGLVHRTIVDEGPIPGVAPMADADYSFALDELVPRVSCAGAWVFAYGSLLWDPVFESGESRVAVARGWHRSFCFWVKRGRGTLDRPGLMMALDRGGQCRGVAFRLRQDTLRDDLDRLLRREIITKPWINLPRMLKVSTPAGPLQALAFVVNRSEARYAGRLALDTVADVLSVAVGHRGTGAEYLLNTIEHLSSVGVHDGGLWDLQRLVAQRIVAARP